MKPRVTFQWIDPCPNERLRVAQQKLLESIEALGLEPSLFHAGPDMVKFAEILRQARQNSVGKSFRLVPFRRRADAKPIHPR